MPRIRYNLTSTAVLLHAFMHAHVSLTHIRMCTGVNRHTQTLHTHIQTELNKQMSASYYFALFVDKRLILVGLQSRVTIIHPPQLPS